MSVATRADVCAPSHLWVPEGSVFHAGFEAADLARSLGFDVDQPEQDALNVLLAESPDGKWAGLEAGIFCGRQNLKTWSAKMLVMYDAWVRDVKRVTWSAHLYKTTQDTFNEIAHLAENTDWLRKRVRKIRYANGEEGFDFVNGAKLDFVARSQKSARGLSADTVILDEALYLTPQMLGALLPTLSARPNPHVVYASSPGVLVSEVARTVRDRGRAGGDPSLTYIEWTSERTPCAKSDCSHKFDAVGCVLDDERKWRSANPALGRRISLDYVRSERRALPPGEFMRERLGWWEDPVTEDDELSAIPTDLWADCHDVKSSVADDVPVAFGVDRSWDRRTTWVAVAARRPDDRVHVELVASGANDEWALAWLADRVQRLSVLGIGGQAERAPVSSLVERLVAELPHDARPLNTSALGKACGSLFDLVKECQVAHIGQEQLDKAIAASRARPLGDAWVFDRKVASHDTAPLMAVAAAVHVLLTTPRKVTPSFIDFDEL